MWAVLCLRFLPPKNENQTHNQTTWLQFVSKSPCGMVYNVARGLVPLFAATCHWSIGHWPLLEPTCTIICRYSLLSVPLFAARRSATWCYLPLSVMNCYLTLTISIVSSPKWLPRIRNTDERLRSLEAWLSSWLPGSSTQTRVCSGYSTFHSN